MTFRRATGHASWRSALDVAAAVAMLLVSGGIVWRWYRAPIVTSTQSAPKVPTTPVSLDGVSQLGAPGATAAVVVFSDFQCPYCARFASELMPPLKERYVDKGLVRIAFRHLPLTALHARAERAAQSADCAAQQGQFWPMYDALFRNPSKLDDIDLTVDAASAGLNGGAFQACMSRPPSDRIKRDSDVAESLGLRGTPSFVIGKIEGSALHATAVFAGLRPLDDFTKALDAVLRARFKTPSGAI